MACCDMKRHAVVHYYTKYEPHSIIQYSTYTSSLVIFQLDISNISGRWRLHNWTSVTYLDHGRYILGRWRSHIRTSLTYLDGECNISGRLLHIWTVTYLHVTRPVFFQPIPVRRVDMLGWKLNHVSKRATGIVSVMIYSISQEICTRFLLCCALLWLYIGWFSHIHQAYFTGTVAI